MIDAKRCVYHGSLGQNVVVPEALSLANIFPEPNNTTWSRETSGMIHHNNLVLITETLTRAAAEISDSSRTPLSSRTASPSPLPSTRSQTTGGSSSLSPCASPGEMNIEHRAANEPLRSFTVSEEVPIKHYVSIRFLMVKVLVNTFNEEKVPVGAFSGHCQTLRRSVGSSRPDLFAH